MIYRPHINSKGLHEECAKGDLNEVNRVLDLGVDFNSDDWPSGFTPLHVCVSGTDSKKRQKIIKLLFDAGADLNMRDEEQGLTALHYSAMRNKPRCGKTLLECGAEVNATEGNGATALHGAAFQGNFEVSEVLLKFSANPSLSDNYGNTPLMLALGNGHSDLYDLMEEY